MSQDIWRTVEIGCHTSAATTVSALKTAGCRLSDWARDVLGKTTFAREPGTFELVKASGLELCGNRNATRAEIFEAGLARGWRLCPAEVGPALREQYQDQPKGEWLLVAMEPIVGADGSPLLFSVGHGDRGRWLSAGHGHPGRQSQPGLVWVFLAPSER